MHIQHIGNYLFTDTARMVVSNNGVYVNKTLWVNVALPPLLKNRRGEGVRYDLKGTDIIRQAKA